MIKEMVKMIDPNIIMYLFNALVFDAKWAVEFDLSYDDKFNNYDESSSTIKMLSSTESTYIEGSGFKGFTKDYKDSKYSFVALLPDEGKDIYDFIDTLNGEGWLNIWNNRNTKSEVIVKMPEFKYELEMNLNDTLKGMGMVDMFSPDSANFSKLGRSTDNLYCSLVKQKVFIELNRTGTRAAAITQIEISSGSRLKQPKLMVILDRPFVYALVDNSTGLPLFVGAVTHLD